MQTVNTEAIVLKNTVYMENDRIYTLMTRDYGKLTAIAKGVRKFGSRRSGSLDTLNYIKIGLTGGSGLRVITEVKNFNSFPKLKSSISGVKDAYYLLEITHRFLEEDLVKNELFSILLSTLLKMNLYPKYSLYLIKSFELKLLSTLGYEMCLDKCTSCGQPYASSWVQTSFSLSKGGFVCQNCRSDGFLIKKETAEVLSFIHNPEIFKDNDRTFPKEADYVVKEFIESVLGKQLKSLKAFGV